MHVCAHVVSLDLRVTDSMILLYLLQSDTEQKRGAPVLMSHCDLKHGVRVKDNGRKQDEQHACR